jgi:hypothetical protein
MLEAGHRTRNGDREMSSQARMRDHLSMGIEKHIARRGQRGLLAEIDEGGAPAGKPQRHEAAAAQVAGCGIDHRKGVADGNRRVDGVAARLEDIHPDLGRQVMRRNDHAPRSGGGRRRGGVRGRDGDETARNCGSERFRQRSARRFIQWRRHR